MRIIKGDKNTDTLRNICGEIINIETGRQNYKDGKLFRLDGPKNEHKFETGSTYIFNPNIGVIYVPSHWDLDKILTWVKKVIKTLSQYPDDHLENIPTAKQNQTHTAVLCRLKNGRDFKITNNDCSNWEHAAHTDNFLWVVKPLYSVFERTLNTDTIVEDFATIIYDKYNLWATSGVVINPDFKQLCVWNQIMSLAPVTITHFKHNDYFCPFFDIYKRQLQPNNPQTLVPRDNLSNLNKVDFPDFEDITVPPHSWAYNAPNLTYCNYCGMPTFNKVYMGIKQQKYVIYCPLCVHSKDIKIPDMELIKWVSKSANKIDDVMNALKIPPFKQAVYRKITQFKKLDIDQASPRQRFYKLDEDMIAVCVSNFTKFITTQQALDIAEHGKIFNAFVIIVR